MKHLLILASLLSFYICDFDGKYSKVIWFKEKQRFENITLKLGEFLISPTIDHCLIKKGKLSIGGRIFLRNRAEQFKYVVLNCSENGTISDTLFKGNQDEKFEVSVKRQMQNFIVIKKMDEDYGLKYLHKSFK